MDTPILIQVRPARRPSTHCVRMAGVFLAFAGHVPYGPLSARASSTRSGRKKSPISLRQLCLCHPRARSHLYLPVGVVYGVWRQLWASAPRAGRRVPRRRRAHPRSPAWSAHHLRRRLSLRRACLHRLPCIQLCLLLRRRSRRLCRVGTKRAQARRSRILLRRHRPQLCRLHYLGDMKRALPRPSLHLPRHRGRFRCPSPALGHPCVGIRPHAREPQLVDRLYYHPALRPVEA